MPFFGAQLEGTGLFFRNTALLLTCVEQPHRARGALSCEKQSPAQPFN